MRIAVRVRSHMYHESHCPSESGSKGIVNNTLVAYTECSHHRALVQEARSSMAFAGNWSN